MRVRVVDFFAGCGGTSMGFKQSSNKNLTYDVVGGVELNPHAAATFERNVGAPILASDIKELLDDAVFQRFKTAVDGEGPLLVIGCAPCQGFSSHRKKDDREDLRNELLEVFANIAVKLNPAVIVMENVPEMLADQNYRHFLKWREIVETAGYKVQIDIHNLAEFGVPQERFRALVVATRWEHFLAPVGHLTHEDFRTVRQAIGHLPPLESGMSDPADPMHVTSKHRASTIDLIKQIPLDGGSRNSLPAGSGLDCHAKVDGFRDVYGRLWWDRPAVAITARCRTPSCGRFTHPEQHRGLSVREAALLQGFPENFYFEGPFDEKFKQIGNAVSPIFAQRLAEHIATEWNANRLTPPSRVSPILELPLTKSFSSTIAHLKRNRTKAVVHA